MTVREYGIQNIPDRMGYSPPKLATVEIDAENWAHGVWTALAVTLAEPLRRAHTAHVAAHCAGDWWRCPEARGLFALLPDGDQIMFA